MTRQPNFIELLESRCLLAVTAALNDNNVFVVTGTDAADDITITMNADATMVQAKSGSTVLGEAAVADVRFIKVDAGAGDDTITVDATVTKRISIDAGDGNDTITSNA